MKCEYLFEILSHWGFILIDESYFEHTHSTFNDNGSNYTSDVYMIQSIIKFNVKVFKLYTKWNFEVKILKSWCVLKSSVVCSPESLSLLPNINNIWTNAFDVVSSLAVITAKSFSSTSRSKTSLSYRSPIICWSQNLTYWLVLSAS